MRHRAAGFTLIEVLATLLIVACVAAVAATTLLRRRSVDLDSVVAEVCEYDLAARAYAQRLSTPVELWIGHDGMSVFGDDRERMVRPPMTLPSGCSMVGLWSDGQSRERLTIRIGPEGRSRTYGMSVRDSKGNARWFVSLGLTGEQCVAETDEAIRCIGELQSQSRDDIP